MARVHEKPHQFEFILLRRKSEGEGHSPVGSIGKAQHAKPCRIIFDLIEELPACECDHVTLMFSGSEGGKRS